MFGIGFESMCSWINTLIAKWFGKQEYCFASSICLMVWRIGTVLCAVSISGEGINSFRISISVSIAIAFIK